MKKFLIKICLCLLPMAVVLVPLATPIVLSREFAMPIEEMAEGFAAGEIKVANFHLLDPTMFNYLRGAVFYENPSADVVVFGTSRSMHFSQRAFDDAQQMVNIAVTSNQTNDIENYKNALQSIMRTGSPEILVVDFRQWDFRQDYRNPDIAFDENYNLFEYTQSDLLPYLNTYIARFFDGERSPIEAIASYSPECLGVGAILNGGGGMTAAGPHHYGAEIDMFYNNTEAYMQRDFEVQRFGQRLGCDSTELNQATLASVEEFLSFAHRQGVHVVAVLPPFSPDFNEEISTSASLAYLQGVYPALKPMFDEYGFELHDYTNAAAQGLTNTDFYNYSHISEVAAAKLLLDMVEQGSALGEYITPEVLRQKIENAYSEIEFEPLLFSRQSR